MSVPNWVVNNLGELGVEVDGRFYFLYKGESLEYKDALNENGTPMTWRPVFKREFGECCHPLSGTVNPDDGGWKPLPPKPLDSDETKR